LQDIDLIDALWRHDIDTEKGANAGVFGASEQYERDLHMLTEKSFSTVFIHCTSHYICNRIRDAICIRNIAAIVDDNRNHATCRIDPD
jgi:hypothetical protein